MNTFLTMLSTESYLEGVLVLSESLKRTKTKYPLTVVITKDISRDIEDILKNFDINVIKIDKQIELPEETTLSNEKAGHAHWNYTLQKLFIFELTQFEKIVYLDSDMIVLDNIDELFTKPHTSAAVAGQQYPENIGWEKLNSGCMVITPRKSIVEKIIKVLPEVQKHKKFFGDQDLLQAYYNEWEKDESLKLDEKYNLFDGYIEYYIKNLGYKLYDATSEKNIAIVHFTGSAKPWMMSKTRKIKNYTKYALAKKFNLIKVLLDYDKLLASVRKKIKSKR